MLQEFIQTFTVVMMLMVHRILGTYNRLNYICLSEFNKTQILKLNSIRGISINENQIIVKPNFMDKLFMKTTKRERIGICY